MGLEDEGIATMAGLVSINQKAILVMFPRIYNIINCWTDISQFYIIVNLDNYQKFKEKRSNFSGSIGLCLGTNLTNFINEYKLGNAKESPYSLSLTSKLPVPQPEIEPMTNKVNARIKPLTEAVSV